MKTATRRTALAVLAGLAILAGLAWGLLPGMVEEAARRSLAELPAALAGEGVALDAPEVEEVRFSLASRELVLRKVRIQGRLQAAPAARAGAPGRGSFLATAEELTGRLTLRGLLLTTPLGRFLLPGAGAAAELFPVAESLAARELTGSVAEEGLALALSLASATAEDVAVDGALLRAVLTGGPAPDTLDWLYGFAATEVRLSGLDLSLDAPQSGESLTASCAEFLARGLERRHLLEQEAQNIRCALPDGRALSVASLRLTAVALPEKALLRPLLRELERKELSETRLQAALKTTFSGREPLAGKSVLAGLVIPLADAGQDEALSLERAALTWASAAPLEQELVIEGFSMPAAPLEAEAGFALPGLSTLALDATLAVHGTGAGASGPERHSGSIRARSLCALGYDFTLDQQGYGAELAALRGTYSGASLRYSDEGLLPRLAASLMPSAEAAMMVIKVGLGRFCAEPTPENAALRAALETFVERPGSLSLSARKPFNLLEAIVTVGGGNAGALMSATAEPGPLSLAEAMRRLGGQGR